MRRSPRSAFGVEEYLHGLFALSVNSAKVLPAETVSRVASSSPRQARGPAQCFGTRTSPLRWLSAPNRGPFTEARAPPSDGLGW